MKVRILTGVLAAALAAGAAPAVQAGMDVQFGAAVNLNDDAQLYFNVSSRYFDREPRVVQDWGRRMSPDDVSVLMFLSARSRRSPEAVFALRQHGLSWWDVSLRLGVPADVWFVPVPVSVRPGPPYGNAYGYWRKHGRNHRAYRLSDVDTRHLVAVRVMHEYYGMPVDRCMELRRGGRSIQTLVGQEYRVRHGKNHARAEEIHDRGGRGGGDDRAGRHDRDDRHGKSGDHGKGKPGKSGKSGKSGHGGGKGH